MKRPGVGWMTRGATAANANEDAVVLVLLVVVVPPTLDEAVLVS
jgi:hypothetical protein